MSGRGGGCRGACEGRRERQRWCVPVSQAGKGEGEGEGEGEAVHPLALAAAGRSAKATRLRSQLRGGE